MANLVDTTSNIPCEHLHERSVAKGTASSNASTGEIQNPLQYRIYSPSFSTPSSSSSSSSSSLTNNTTSSSKSLTYIKTTALRFIEEPIVLTNQTTTQSITYPSSSSELNRSDLVEIQCKINLLDADEKQFLRHIKKKVECYPQSFDRDEYVERSCLLTLSGYPRAQRYTLCNAGPKRAKCKRHHYCPLCNFLTRQNALKTYLPAYHKGQWHHVILSFDGTLPFTSNSADTVRLHWDACSAALRESTAQELIRGAYWVEELKIRSFLPTQVLPHTHAIVEADEVGESIVELMEKVITASFENANDAGVTLQPNIQVKPIDSEESLYDRIRYLYKTVDLLKPYRAAWELVEINGRSLAVELNSQLRECIDGHFSVTQGKSRMYCNGILSPNAHEFIGVKKKDRQEYAAYVADVAAGRRNCDD
jgi:hypothetical protein